VAARGHRGPGAARARRAAGRHSRQGAAAPRRRRPDRDVGRRGHRGRRPAQRRELRPDPVAHLVRRGPAGADRRAAGPAHPAGPAGGGRVPGGARATSRLGVRRRGRGARPDGCRARSPR
jgi:hypothetical protein